MRPALTRALALFALGGVCGWLQGPLNAWWATFFAFPALLYFLEGTQGWAAFRRGWLFAFSYFVFGLYWISVALFVDIQQFWWALPLAITGLPLVLALFVGVAIVLTERFGRDALGRVLLFSIFWVGAEWLRGHVFTGFPWLLLGGMWVDVDAVRPLAALGGAYGLSFWAVLVATLPYVLWRGAGRAEKGWAGGLLAFLIILAFGWSAVYTRLPVTDRGQLAVRVVQPNIPQTMKMNPAFRADMVGKALALSKTGTGQPQAIIWPESALPFLLEQSPDIRKAVGTALPEGALLITGTTRRTDSPTGEPLAFHNSLSVLDGAGALLATYDKAHLVPFGEYIPFREWLPFDPIAGGIDFAPGPGPRTLRVGTLPSFSPLICYESIFPESALDLNDLPDFLVVVTNDGWYGLSHGPYQHLDIARIRAVETGLPVVRAANTGISAVIDASGAVLAHLPLGEEGALDYTLQVAHRVAPAKKYGDMFVFLACIAMFGLNTLRRYAVKVT